MFRKVLIANRGEIAVRVIRACRELGIPTVAVHSEADAGALHTRLADEAICIGPADPRSSYLHIPAIVAAAEITQADAIHPGYGFLSENAEFANTCDACKLTFIGPQAESIERWGNKVLARKLAVELGLPVFAGSETLNDVNDAVTQAKKIGFPVMLKAAGGGGGRGMHVCRDAAAVEAAFPVAHAEALAAFDNASLYLEPYLDAPRHIEFQVLGDGEGDVIVLGDRECSIQRRHQKILEEAPSPTVPPELRQDMQQTIRRVMSELQYRSAGTLEFLMDDKNRLTFLEMNPRIQVEHPVTEMVTGVDLVAEQIRVAAGEGLGGDRREFAPRGHAIECRINAEDPVTFAPRPGTITEYHPPGGAGVRVDSGVFGGWRVPVHYDSMLLKVISHGNDRPHAIARMRRALTETILGGIETNTPLHLRILDDPDFQAGRISTGFLERFATKRRS